MTIDPPSPDRILLTPREATVLTSRILRQASWAKGIEAAVGAIVLGTHLAEGDGLDALERDWASIAAATPAAITAHRDAGAGWRIDGAGAHAFVCMPTVLDHLLPTATGGDRQVVVTNCTEAQHLTALSALAAPYGLVLSVRPTPDGAEIVARRAAEGELGPPAEPRLYPVSAALLAALRQRADNYLVPESEASRSHAGDGTRAFPLEPERVASSGAA
ncbi:MAG: hypothetical protein IAE87_12290 [Rhodobacteraceae bacterium]|jgi:hypothetical protein|nr:hypothetical protein [Paracoccaceae bacterium]MCA9862496.1 hypothetical protein [Thermomicrobiales bacterium]